MKKAFILSLAFVATLGAKADVITYDFNTNPSFFSLLYLPEEQDGWAWSGEYDLIDKTGMAINTDGSMFNEKDENSVWHAVQNRCIDLTDGLTYTLEGNDGDFTPVDMSHPFLCWDQEGVGPTRTHYFNGWNKAEEWADEDYNAVDADNWVQSKGALGFLRNGNTGSRKGTYVQFPVVENPTKITLWIGNQGGNYHEEGLYAEVVPVVNGEAGEPIPGAQIADNSAYKAKRYYKFELPVNLTGEVAFRVGCGGSQVQLYHIEIEAGDGSGIFDVTSGKVNSDAPAYSLSGVKVGKDYKGVVIKNGQKFIQK